MQRPSSGYSYTSSALAQSPSLENYLRSAGVSAVVIWSWKGYCFLRLYTYVPVPRSTWKTNSVALSPKLDKCFCYHNHFWPSGSTIYHSFAIAFGCLTSSGNLDGLTRADLDKKRRAEKQVWTLEGEPRKQNTGNLR